MKFKIVRGLLLGAFIVSLSTVVVKNQAVTVAQQEQMQQSENEMAVARTAEEGNSDVVLSKSARTSNFVASAGVIDAFKPYITEEAAIAVSAVEGGQAARVVAELIQTSAQEETQPAIAIATVDNYVNVRSNPTTEGEVVGKLYNHSVGTVLTEEAGWYQIQSGNVTGYVKSEYVLTGEAGAALADEVGQHLATVTTTTLKVRVSPSTEDKVLGLVPEGDTLEILEELDGWVKVAVEEGEGYVSTDYVDTYVKNVQAESKEEEEARLAKEEAERKAAEEAARKALEAKQAKQNQSANKQSSKKQSTSGTTGSNSSNASGSSSGSSASNSSAGTSNASLGQQIASYAQQFVGNPYVYGGTSLTNGADCSGFVQSVYKNYGISLPRTSGEQGASGRAVGSLSEAQPGDLLWYSGHIAIYIGNGQIVHASTSKTGIIISNATYRPILSIRRIV